MQASRRFTNVLILMTFITMVTSTTPAPQEEIDAQNQAKAEQMASAMLGEGDKGKRSDKLNQSSTGLNIT